MIPTVDKITVNKESFSKVFDKAVRDGKSCGPDNVSATDLLKKSVETGSFPSDWKKAKVTCVYKKGSKKCCSNYRPISLLSIPSKVVERYICSILQTHLDSFNLLSEYQWGFRKHSSTEDLLLNMTERWRHAIDNGKSVVVLFIDFQKAFDSVSHPILLRKLAACGIPGELLEYLESYLSGRKQFTVVNGEHSQLQNICYGLPQGSTLGPDCFSMNVNDMFSKVCNNDGNSEVNLFADDCKAFEIGDTVDEALSRMKSTANNVHNYSNKTSLTVHPEKCHLMILTKDKFIEPLK